MEKYTRCITDNGSNHVTWIKQREEPSCPHVHHPPLSNASTFEFIYGLNLFFYWCDSWSTPLAHLPPTPDPLEDPSIKRPELPSDYSLKQGMIH